MKTNRGIIALLLAILIWGSTLVISKIALEGMGAMTLTFGRFLIAYLLLFPLAARQGYRIKQSFQWDILPLGLTGVALHYTLQNIALLYTSAMSAALISAGGTFIITLTAILFLKERPTTLQLIGICVSVAGVILISLAEDPNPNSTNPLLGNLLFLLGTVAWSAYHCAGKAPDRENTHVGADHCQLRQRFAVSASHHHSRADPAGLATPGWSQSGRGFISGRGGNGTAHVWLELFPALYPRQHSRDLP